VRTALLLPVVAILAAGCGVDHGTITAKGYDPPSSETEIMTIGNCTCYPMTTWQPECWRVDLRDGYGPDAPTGSECVDRTLWDTLKVGEYFGQKLPQ
jgi:hypothetical protein